jgi:hypothetical protein
LKNEDGSLHEMPGEALPPPVTSGLPAGTRKIAFLALFLLVPVTAVCGWKLGTEAALAAAVGGLIGLVNFWLLGRLVVQVTSGVELAVGPLLVRMLSKLALLGVCLFALIVWGGIDVVGLAVGLSVVVVSTMLSQAFGLLE